MKIDFKDFLTWAENLDPGILKYYENCAQAHYLFMQDEDLGFDLSTTIPLSYLKALEDLLALYKNEQICKKQKAVKDNVVYLNFKEKR